MSNLRHRQHHKLSGCVDFANRENFANAAVSWPWAGVPALVKEARSGLQNSVMDRRKPNLGQISVYGAAACTVDTGLETPRRGVEETMLFGCVATLVHVLPRQTDDNDVANDVDNDGDDDDYYYSAFQLCKAFDLGSEICQAYR